MSLYKRRRKVTEPPSVVLDEPCSVEHIAASDESTGPHCTLQECIFCCNSFSSLIKYGLSEEKIENEVNNRDLSFLRVLQLFQRGSGVQTTREASYSESLSWNVISNSVFDSFTAYDAQRDAYGVVPSRPERSTSGYACICDTCTVTCIACTSVWCPHFTQQSSFDCCDSINDQKSRSCLASSIHQFTPGEFAPELERLLASTASEYFPLSSKSNARYRRAVTSQRAEQQQSHARNNISQSMIQLAFLVNLFQRQSGKNELQRSDSRAVLMEIVATNSPIHQDMLLFIFQSISKPYIPSNMPRTPVHNYHKFLSPIPYAMKNPEIALPSKNGLLQLCNKYCELKQLSETMPVSECLLFLLTDLLVILDGISGVSEYTDVLFSMKEYISSCNKTELELLITHINTSYPFGVELNNDGKRSYAVCSIAAMVYRQFATDPTQRCFYEIIQTNNKSRFYCDIEFKMSCYRAEEARQSQIVWNTVSKVRTLMNAYGTDWRDYVHTLSSVTRHEESFNLFQTTKWSICEYIKGPKTSHIDKLVHTIDQTCALSSLCYHDVRSSFTNGEHVVIPAPQNLLLSGSASLRALLLCLFVFLRNEQPTISDDDNNVLFLPIFAAWLVKDLDSTNLNKFSRHLTLPLVGDAVFSNNYLIGSLIDKFHRLVSNNEEQQANNQVFTCSLHKHVIDSGQYQLLNAEKEPSWASFSRCSDSDITIEKFLDCSFPVLSDSIHYSTSGDEHSIHIQPYQQSYLSNRKSSILSSIYDRAVYTKNRCYRLPYGVKQSQPERVLYTSQASNEARSLATSMTRASKKHVHPKLHIMGLKRELLRDILVIPFSPDLQVKSSVFQENLVSIASQDSPIVIGGSNGIVNVPLEVSKVVLVNEKRYYQRRVQANPETTPDWYFVHQYTNIPAGDCSKILKNVTATASTSEKDKLGNFFSNLDNVLITVSKDTLSSSHTTSSTGTIPSPMYYMDCRVFRHVQYQLILYCQAHCVCPSSVPLPTCSAFTYDCSTHTISYTYLNAVCWRKGRPHRSNGTIHSVQLSSLCYTQSCYDRECTGNVNDILQ